MASTNIYRVPSSTGNQKTFTFSFWWKTSPDGQDKCLFSSGLNTSNYFMVRTTGAETLQILSKDNGSTGINYQSTQSFRDCNGWYHIVLTIDTTQAGGNRVKYYVNGERVTSFLANTEVNQNSNVLYVNDTTIHAWGRKNVTADKWLNGSLSHVHFIDGTAYDASAFGETDTTTGEWKAKTSPSVTYGTNGYFIFKDGNSVTDQSGNSNNWQVGNGTLTNTEDSPSNVFCTMNLLSKGSDITLTNGNTVVTNSQTSDQSIVGTIACGNGKYYWEAKCTSNTSNYSNIGITLSSKFGGNHSGVDSGRIMWSSNGSLYKEGLGLSSVSLGALGTNDIIGVALDTENGTLKFYKDGVLIHTETNNSFLYSNNEYIPASGLRDGGGWNYNFGNGYFGTTAVSSAGTNASGIGIFEYDVPAGFTALSTKGLNE